MRLHRIEFEVNYGLILIFSFYSKMGFFAFSFSRSFTYGAQKRIIAALNNSYDSYVLCTICPFVVSVLSLKRQRMAAWNTLVMSWYFLGVNVI